MRHLPTLDLVRRELRMKACSRCPHHPRPGGTGAAWAACEAACPVFIFLPALVALAERLDPIVADRPAALRRRLAALCARHRTRPPRGRRAASAPPAAVPPPDVADAAADVIVATVGE